MNRLTSIPKISILAGLLAFFSFANGDDVDMLFSAWNLPSRDLFKVAPDAYLNLYHSSSPAVPFVLMGQTREISDNRNPEWPDVFSVNYTSEQSEGPQKLKIDVYDADWPDSDDYMGSVEIALYELINSYRGIVVRDLIGGNPGGGQLEIKLKNEGRLAKMIRQGLVEGYREGINVSAIDYAPPPLSFR